MYPLVLTAEVMPVGTFVKSSFGRGFNTYTRGGGFNEEGRFYTAWIYLYDYQKVQGFTSLVNLSLCAPSEEEAVSRLIAYVDALFPLLPQPSPETTTITDDVDF